MSLFFGIFVDGIIRWPNGKIEDKGLDFGCPSPTHSSSCFLFQSNAHEYSSAMLLIRNLCCENQDILISSCIHLIACSYLRQQCCRTWQHQLSPKKRSDNVIGWHYRTIDDTEFFFAIDLDFYHQIPSELGSVDASRVERSVTPNQPFWSVSSYSSPIPKIRWCLKYSPTHWLHDTAEVLFPL